MALHIAKQKKPHTIGETLVKPCAVDMVKLLLGQGRPTRGPRKGFEWPAQCFLKPSVLLILAEVEDKFDVKALFSSIFIKFGPGKDFEWPAQCFLEHSVTMILILLQKVANRRLISGEDLFFLKITIILMQKVGCLLCMARQYFLCVKMALGSKRLDTPVLGEPSEKRFNKCLYSTTQLRGVSTYANRSQTASYSGNQIFSHVRCATQRINRCCIMLAALGISSIHTYIKRMLKKSFCIAILWKLQQQLKM